MKDATQRFAGIPNLTKNINFELTFLVKSRIQNVTKNVNFELTFFLQDVNFELTSFLENVNSELTFSKNVNQSEA